MSRLGEADVRAIAQRELGRLLQTELRHRRARAWAIFVGVLSGLAVLAGVVFLIGSAALIITGNMSPDWDFFVPFVSTVAIFAGGYGVFVAADEYTKWGSVL